MNKLYILIVLIFTTSCASSEFSRFSKGCSKLYKNSYAAIDIRKYKIGAANDTTSLNELRFLCVGHHGYTHQVMYDQFGRWDDAYALTMTKDRMLVWKDVDLFSDNKKYSVYTFGLDDQEGPLFASVMVVDENENDMLAADSKIKEALIDYFSEKIKNMNNSIDFMREYWTTFYPEIWEEILQKNPSYK